MSKFYITADVSPGKIRSFHSVAVRPDVPCAQHPQSTCGYACLTAMHCKRDVQ